MHKLIAIWIVGIMWFFILLSAFADDSIPFNTSTGKAKVSTSGIGTASKPYDFTAVTVTGISGSGGAPGGLTGQLQYKSGASAFGGIPSLTYDGGTVVLTLAAGTKFNIVDPTDLTKKVRLTLSGITTGSTRTTTVPNADNVWVIPTTATTNQFITAINSTGTQLKAQPTDANLLTSDVTTNNVSITKHGFAPKAPNDATKFLNGVGAYTVPAGGSGVPGGADTQAQYNIGGTTFGGIPGLTSDGTTAFIGGGAKSRFTDFADPTKKLGLNLSNIPTATTRTLTFAAVDSVTVAPDAGASNNFLTGISALGVVTKAQPTFGNINGVIAIGQQFIPIGKTLYVDTSNGVNITAVPNRLDKPYLTLNGAAGAIADASAGDQIIIGPGTFTETGAIVLPQNVAFIGSGAGITTIVTASGIVAATGDKIADFTIDARTASNASFSFGIGADSSDTAFTDVTISGVEILGNTDGFYFNKAGIDRVNISDCLVSTTFDTVFMGNLTGTVNITNTDMFADGSIGGAGITSGVNATKGILNLYGGSVTLSNGVLEARGVRATGTGTVVNVHGTTFSETATTKFDLHQSSSAVVANDKAVRTDRAALVTSGTITQYVNTYEGNLGLSDVITGNVSILKHGLAPKAPNDATQYLDGTGAYSVPAGSSGVTAGTGIDITSGVVSVSPGVIDDQLEDTTPTLDDFMMTVNTTGDILQKVSLANLAANLSLDSVTDDSTNFTATFNTSALTANRGVFIPDVPSTFVGPSLRSASGNRGKILSGIGTDGIMTWDYEDISTTAQFTSNQNNFTPASPTHYLKLSTDGTRNLTGLVGSGTDGETKYIICTGNSLVITNEDSGSTAANRFHNSTGADITLASSQVGMIVYNTNLSRWIGIGPLGVSAVGGSNTQVQYNNSGAPGGISTLKYNGSQVTQQAGTSYALLDSSDNTKKAVFDLSNITTGTSRTVNIPDSANSVTVIGGSATANQFLTNITTGGVQNKAQAGISDLSASTSAALAAVLTNETGTGVAVFNTSPALVTPDLGTPTTLTLTSATGLPITGITSSTSAQLRTLLSDENGTGAALFDSSTSATFITPILGTPTSGTLTNCTGGGGYTMNGGIMGVTVSPADSTTYYFGYGETNTTAQHTTIANMQMIVPKTGTITRIQWMPFIVTNGSNEATSHFLRLNNTTDTTLSTSETYDPGANTVKSFSYTGLSIAVTAGDTIAFKVTTPAWATNPTIGSAHLMVWIE